MLEILGAPIPTPLDRSEPNLACLSRSMVCTYPPNLSDSVFSVATEILPFFHVILWWLRPALQRQSWTRVHPLRISKCWWRSGVHKLCYLKAWQTNKKTNKQTNKKHWTFSPPSGARCPSPTKLGTQPRARDSKSFPFSHLSFIKKVDKRNHNTNSVHSALEVFRLWNI